MAPKYSEIIKGLGSSRVKRNEPMCQHTSFRVGGPVDLFYEARTSDEVVRAIRLARKHNLAFFLLGEGSNLLVADEGFRGLVIKISNFQFSIFNSKIRAGAGVKLGELVEAAAEAGLGGLEFAAGIPGSVAGAVVGNAGAWQRSIGEKVLQVKVLTGEGETKWLSQADCRFSYRHSRFKQSQEAILKIELGLAKKEKKEIKKQIEINLEKRQGQPKKASAGCIFINPKPLSAGKMIEECGLKGKRIGQAQVSYQHANFIVNLNQAKASDILQLIKLVKKAVKEKFGIDLKEEIQLIGFGKQELNNG